MITKNRKAYLLYLLSPLFFFCTAVVTTQVTTLDNISRPVTGFVEVFDYEEDVPYQFKKIGIIDIEDNGWGSSYMDLVAIARDSARGIGATGLIIHPPVGKSAGHFVVTGLNKTRVETFRAIAIAKLSDGSIRCDNVALMREIKKMLNDSLISVAAYKQLRSIILDGGGDL